MDCDQSFIDKILPHVKSFSYTWFHLQAAKRKHFKNEDKRMNYDDELRLKQQLQNELPSVKLKWAIRLLMKLKKDIQKLNQKDLIEIVSNSNSSNESTQCVLSNPDMKGKMRRIDCLRQSDKVWRLDLVMVVLFKGIPLESSDGERLDKLPECKHPTLCVNPNHALLNVRDLEVFLANYINNSYNSQSNVLNDVKLYCSKNIMSASVFTPQEFLNLSHVSIVEGASESDIKTSLINTGSSNMSNHYSDNDNDEPNEDDKSVIKQLTTPSVEVGPKKTKKVKASKINETLEAVKTKSNVKINELIEQIEKSKTEKTDFELTKNETSKKPTLKRRRSSNHLKLTSEQVLDENAITDPSDAPVNRLPDVTVPGLLNTEDQSSQSSQQDDEIKELLLKSKYIIKNGTQKMTDELKDLMNNKTADVFLKKLLNGQDCMNNISLIQNSDDALKAATPVFELLMSPLFNTMLPNSNSNSSSSSSNSSNSVNTNTQQTVRTTFNNLVQSQQKSQSPTVFKKARIEKQNKGPNQSSNQINNSLINALKFDSSFDELITNITQQTQTNQNELTQQQQQFINKLISLSPTLQFTKPKSRVHTPNQNEDDEKETSSSPPPPPSIGTTVHPHSVTIAPSPTKLFIQSNNNIQMHRPIPILQKADAVVSNLINNLNKSDQNTTSQNQINSPVMFNNNSLFSSNSNFFSNYPNISPALNGSGSPTNLFPSITSLFQSPIGTPRVTPTPQQFAAYFLSDDQYHSLIFPNNNDNQETNILNLYQTNSGHLSPLIFNNILNNSSQTEQTTQTQNSKSNSTSGLKINV